MKFVDTFVFSPTGNTVVTDRLTQKNMVIMSLNTALLRTGEKSICFWCMCGGRGCVNTNNSD